MDDGAARLEREFNGYGEVENQTLTVNGKAVGEVALTRDDVGRIIAKTEVIDGVTFEYQYEYDGFGRLTVVRDGTGSELERYTYGPQGERLTETNVLRGIVSRSFTYDDEDRLLTAGDVNYTFDVDGFLTSKTDGSETTTYDYSSRGELKKVELPDGKVVEYRHDPIGRRVAKLVDGVVVEKYLWHGRTKLLAVYNGDGTLKSRFLYADARMPMGMVQDGETYYFAYDQVGSLRAVTDATGAVVKTVRYDSFGNVIEDSDPDMAVPFGFAGGLHDRDTGLIRFGYRDYDPDTGRWTAKDPIGFYGKDVLLYIYSSNSPIDSIDITGLSYDTSTIGLSIDMLKVGIDFSYTEYYDSCGSLEAQCVNLSISLGPGIGGTMYAEKGIYGGTFGEGSKPSSGFFVGASGYLTFLTLGFSGQATWDSSTNGHLSYGSAVIGLGAAIGIIPIGGSYCW